MRPMMRLPTIAPSKLPRPPMMTTARANSRMSLSPPVYTPSTVPPSTPAKPASSAPSVKTRAKTRHVDAERAHHLAVVHARPDDGPDPRPAEQVVQAQRDDDRYGQDEDPVVRVDDA